MVCVFETQRTLTDRTNRVAEGAYKVRTMDRQEVGLAIDWAAAEGWNPGLHDANCFYAADPEGFLVGLLGDEPVATISVVKYGSSFGFVGFYIVAPVHRGCGYGIKIWNTGLARLQGRTVGLDGVVDQQENYKKSGFVLAHRNIRYEGTGFAARTPRQPSSRCPSCHSTRYRPTISSSFPTRACSFSNAGSTSR